MASDGSLSWLATYGGTGDEYLSQVTVDSSNNPIIGGNFFSPTMSMGAYSLTSTNGDAFVAKLSGSTGAVTCKSI